MSEEHPADPAPVAAAPEPAAAPSDAVATPPQPVEPGPAEGAAAGAPAATDPAPTPEPPAVPEIKPHTDEPGLLQTTEAAAEPAPVEGEKPAEPIPEPPAYEFAVPEGLTIPEQRLYELRSAMGAGNVPTETADKLWGMHIAAMQEFQAHTLQAQHDAFAEYRRDERLKIAADPEVGGAGFQTNQAAARRMLDMIARDPGGDPAKTAANSQEINEWLSATGATDSYALFKGLVRLSKILDEPQSGPPPSPSPPSPRQQAGRAPGGGNSRLGYVHPRGGARTS